VRLNSIKLSGFKSFAEPTHFMLPGQLVGVVGPNGCGKSNIIDAVRWVLGESRASELRGESMQDVIFNGTTTRKSSSRSSVELIFDNGDHRAGGQWSQFPEIAVKRVLTRDGTSSYYINNQPVRRRDVQDVFLGTGLGPRAYAIIGQGTISRIIESKPEELRLFLEEAAGVSKYKERRRETENRLSDTRENLTRVEDILRELNANLEKLERQAEVAQRYKDLQQQVGLKQQQFWFLKRAEALADQTQLQESILQATNGLESKVADLRHIEADLETINRSKPRPPNGMSNRFMPKRKSNAWPAKAPMAMSKRRFCKPSAKSSKAICPSWKTLCAKRKTQPMSNACKWCKCNSKFRFWPPINATSKNKTAKWSRAATSWTLTSALWRCPI